MAPAVGRSSPTARLSSVVLPAPFGPTSPTTGPRDLQRAVRQGPLTAVLLAEPGGGQGGGHATSSAVGDRNVSWNSASMLSSSRPARPGLGQPAPQVLAQRAVGGERDVAQVLDHEGPDPRPGCDQARVLELLVGLEHRVRVDGQRVHRVLDRRQLVALAQQAEPQRMPYLLDDLLVRRQARTRVQVKLDHGPLRCTN